MMLSLERQQSSCEAESNPRCLRAWDRPAVKYCAPNHKAMPSAKGSRRAYASRVLAYVAAHEPADLSSFSHCAQNVARTKAISLG